MFQAHYLGQGDNKNDDHETYLYQKEKKVLQTKQQGGVLAFSYYRAIITYYGNI